MLQQQRLGFVEERGTKVFTQPHFNQPPDHLGPDQIRSWQLTGIVRWKTDKVALVVVDSVKTGPVGGKADRVRLRALEIGTCAGLLGLSARTGQQDRGASRRVRSTLPAYRPNLTGF